MVRDERGRAALVLVRLGFDEGAMARDVVDGLGDGEWVEIEVVGGFVDG